MTDGNTYAINHHLAEREAYDEQQEQEAELQDLRDEVDTLTARLAEVTAENRELAMQIISSDGQAIDAYAAQQAAEAKLAEVTEERDRQKGRGDNHWETLRSIRDIAKSSGDLDRIIQWVNDAGQGYCETVETTLSKEMDRAEAAEAALKTARRDALEEAAQYMYQHWDDDDAQLHREAIRALIDEGSKP